MGKLNSFHFIVGAINFGAINVKMHELDMMKNVLE